MRAPTERSAQVVTAAPWVALVAAIVPAIVMVIRAAVEGWAPVFDAAYFTVRSRDVGTAHHPMVGAWSMGSREIGQWVNNLGPLQLDLLAPFTRINPYWGTAAGVAALNISCIVGVWLVARRLVGPLGVTASMFATLVLQLNFGSLMLIEARQQLALLMPLWLFLWLATAAVTGRRWAAPWLVAVASLLIQTHFTFVYQTLALLLLAVAALIVAHRHHVRRLAPTAALSIAVGLVCWAQPLWDQGFGSGNLGKVLGHRSGTERSLGFADGIRILAEAGFVPPSFVPGSTGNLLNVGTDRPPLWLSVVAMGVWLTALVFVAVLTWRGDKPVAAMAGVSAAAVLAAVYAVSMIPPTEQFGVVRQNYYWAWPIGIFAATALLGGALSIARERSVTVQRLLGAPAASGLLGAAALVLAIPLLWPRTHTTETDHEWNVGRQQVRPLLVQFDQALTSRPLDEPVVVELGSSPYARYALLAVLQEHGVDFRFQPGSTDLSRFGVDRCDDGSAAWRLELRGGRDAIDLGHLGEIVSAEPGLTSAEVQRFDQLAEQFGDAVRDGSVTLDRTLINESDAAELALFDRVVANDGLSARGLDQFLANYEHYDVVTVADDLRADLDEWRALGADSDNERMAIYLQPLDPSRPDLCDAIAPGEEFLRLPRS